MALSASANLQAHFFVRLPTRLWTNRRYLNGVVELSGLDMGDAILEYVIEGVMEDIQGVLEANDIDYSTWTNIVLVPKLIKRATTYAVVASLYARRSKTFRSRVIPTISPVNVVVTGDDERAMEHWEGRYETAIDLYITTIGTDRLLVSTADEEPVFSMDDIVETITDETSWHEWVAQRET